MIFLFWNVEPKSYFRSLKQQFHWIYWLAVMLGTLWSLELNVSHGGNLSMRNWQKSVTLVRTWTARNLIQFCREISFKTPSIVTAVASTTKFMTSLEKCKSIKAIGSLNQLSCCYTKRINYLRGWFSIYSLSQCCQGALYLFSDGSIEVACFLYLCHYLFSGQGR